MLNAICIPAFSGMTCFREVGALFEIDDARAVTILAMRHPREEDYH